jgi:enoyl-[acyl-carrier protein] reductase I
MAGVLEGKRGLIMGVANERSIAWGIAQEARAQGAELAFTYVGEALQKRVRPLAESLGSDIVLPCDVQSDEDIRTLFSSLSQSWDKLDFIVHAVAPPTRTSSRIPSWTRPARDSAWPWTSRPTP